MSDPLHRAPSFNDAALSETGIGRRDRMLNELVGHMRQAHAARRTRRRSAIAAFAILVLFVGAAVLSQRTINPSAQVDHGSVAAIGKTSPIKPSEPTAPAAVIVRFHTQPDIVARYAAGTNQDSSATAMRVASRLTDDELLSMLATMERPTGLIRADGRVWLTRNVADDAIAEPAVNESNSS